MFNELPPNAAEQPAQTKCFVAIVREALHIPPDAAQTPVKGFFRIVAEALKQSRID